MFEIKDTRLFGGEGDVPYFDPDKVNISFNGCGFLGIYHVGVAAALKAYVPHMKIESVCGASAGALAAVCLLADVPCDKMAHELMLASSECRQLFGGPLNPGFDVCQRLRDSLTRLLPEDIHKEANGKLYISVTSVYTGENVIICNFSSRHELIDSVVASTFIPVFSGILPTRIRGVPVIDGGFSVNQVVINCDTITVSPFAGDAHICPSDDKDGANVVRLYVAHAGTNVSWENLRRLSQVLYPPRAKVMSDLMMQGFLDCTKFLCNFGIMSRPLSMITLESHLSASRQKEQDGTEKASLPETLTHVVTNFLEREIKSGQTTVNNVMRPNSRLASLVYNTIYITFYYNPAVIVGRMSFNVCSAIIRKLISVSQSFFPFLEGKDNEFLKMQVEKFLGILIGYFGPIIGYEFKFVRVSDRPQRASQAIQPEPQVVDSKSKFTCDVHIHEFKSGDRETANKRRQSIFQRRKSLSLHTLNDERHPFFSTPSRRRFSIAPNMEGSLAQPPPPPPPAVILPSQILPKAENKGSEDGVSGLPIDPMLEEDEDTEVLSLQVESYVNQPFDLTMPSSAEEALHLQVENLEAANASRDGSRRVSRRGSIFTSSHVGSGLHTPDSSRCATPSSIHSHNQVENPGDGDEQIAASETLQNIVKMTRDQESIFKTYYTDENGELVTVALYDIADASTILGQDAMLPDPRSVRQTDENEFSHDVARRLDRLHQLYGPNGERREVDIVEEEDEFYSDDEAQPVAV